MTVGFFILCVLAMEATQYFLGARVANAISIATLIWAAYRMGQMNGTPPQTPGEG